MHADRIKQSANENSKLSKHKYLNDSYINIKNCKHHI